MWAERKSMACGKNARTFLTYGVKGGRYQCSEFNVNLREWMHTSSIWGNNDRLPRNLIKLFSITL